MKTKKTCREKKLYEGGLDKPALLIRRTINNYLKNREVYGAETPPDYEPLKIEYGSNTPPSPLCMSRRFSCLAYPGTV